MIKTGGENVASREVEEAIYRLPQVSEVAVIGLPHPQWIEAVTAVVVVKAGQALDAAGARRALPGSTWPASRCRSAWSSARRCRRTRAASCSSASCGNNTNRRVRAVTELKKSFASR